MIRSARASRDKAPASEGVTGCPTNRMRAGHWGTLGPRGWRAAPLPLGPQENLIDSIVDVDIADAQVARGVSIKVLPGNAPMVLVQYRVPIASSREFAGARHGHAGYGHIATNVRSGIVTVQPPGPLGIINARLRPEAAPRFLGDCVGAFANVKIGLADLLKRQAVSALEDAVAMARTSAERIALVTRFLNAHLREADPDPLVTHAAKRLRLSPTLRIRPLAKELNVSERSLCRRFRAVFGVSPKEFARSARLEKVLAARASGLTWAQVSYACGFADQPHMIHDTRAILGSSPEQILRPEPAEKAAGDQGALYFW